MARIDRSIELSSFQRSMKADNITQVFTKDDRMDKTDHRLIN